MIFTKSRVTYIFFKLQMRVGNIKIYKLNIIFQTNTSLMIKLIFLSIDLKKSLKVKFFIK